MQSTYFDGSVYQGSIYGSSVGNHGNIQPTAEQDVGCCFRYTSSSVHNTQDEGCRGTPAYMAAATLAQPHDGGPCFRSSNSYKSQIHSLDVEDQRSRGTSSHSQDNFLLKPQDAPALASTPPTRGSSSNMTTSLHTNQSHYSQYHHLPQHHQLENSFQLMSENNVGAGLVENDPVFRQASVKLETLNLNQSPGQEERGKQLNTSAPPTSLNVSRNVQADLRNNTPDKNTATDNSQPFTETALCTSKKFHEDFPGKDSVDDKHIPRDSKPTMSYIALIAKAILESEDRRLNLGSIYTWIENHFPFYKSKGQGWRNSVRHNLSLNDCFIKAGRCEDGKGNYWAIHPANIQDFMRGDFRQRRRSRRRGRRKECDLSMYHLPPPGSSLTPGVTFNSAALNSLYSPYTEAERSLQTGRGTDEAERDQSFSQVVPTRDACCRIQNVHISPSMQHWGLFKLHAPPLAADIHRQKYTSHVLNSQLNFSKIGLQKFARGNKP